MAGLPTPRRHKSQALNEITESPDYKFDQYMNKITQQNEHFEVIKELDSPELRIDA